MLDQVCQLVCSDDGVGHGPVGARSRPCRDDRDASIGRAATERQRCEVSIRGQDHELVVSSLCAQGVHGIEHQVDVGTAFALLGQRRAVDDAEACAREVRPELREDRGVQVAGSNQEPSGELAVSVVAGLQRGEPVRRGACKRLGGSGVEAFQTYVHVVEIHEESASQAAPIFGTVNHCHGPILLVMSLPRPHRGPCAHRSGD